MTGRRKDIWIVNLVLALLLFGYSGFTYGQSAQFKAVASKTSMAVGERFRVEFTVNAGGDEFQPPSFGDFRVLSGPNQATNMQFVNGKSSYSISFSYVLMATKEGTFDLGPANIKVSGNVVSSNILKINVSKGSVAGNSSANSGSNQGNQQAASSGANESLIIVPVVSNSRPFVGESLTVTYKLYFNQRILELFASSEPSFTGFWNESIDTRNANQETDYINGIKYNVAPIKQSLLIPQQSGELKIDELALDVVVQKVVQSRSRNLFDQFFGNTQNVKVSVKSKPLTINVRPLPAGRPSAFDGAVGNFSVKLTADRMDVKANDAINLTYKISGRGNLKLLNDPVINFPSDFEVYDPKTSDKINVSASGMKGERSYNYLVIPRHNGDFEVETPAFTYFDPIKEKYITLNIDKLLFNIEKGDDEELNITNFSSSNKEEIKYLGSDIRYIKTDTELLSIGYSFFGTWLYYLLWLLPIPLFLAFWKLKSILDEKRGDTQYMQRSRANKMAERRLSTAKKLLQENQDHAFYEEVFKAMYGFFSDKFNLKTAELSKEKIEETLIRASLDSAIISETLRILNQCEMARFAPTSDVDREKVYTDSVALLSKIQKNLK